MFTKGEGEGGVVVAGFGSFSCIFENFVVKKIGGLEARGRGRCEEA